MKKSFLVLASVMVFGLTNVATAGTDNRSSEQSRKLSQTLQLDESAYIKIKQLNDQKYRELDKAVVLYVNDGALKQVKISEIENTFNMKVEAVLNSSQKVAFQNYLTQNTSNIAIGK